MRELDHDMPVDVGGTGALDREPEFELTRAPAVVIRSCRHDIVYIFARSHKLAFLQ